MPKDADRHLADDGDRRRVDEFGRLVADERRAEQAPGGTVDDDLGAPHTVVTQQSRTRGARERHRDGDDVMPRFARLSLARADRRDLRVREHDLRDGNVTRRRRLVRAGESGAEHARLVLAHVCQRRAAAGVTDGVQPGRQAPGAHVVRVDADRVETDVVEARATAGGEQEFVGDDPLAARFITFDGERHRPAVHATEAGVGGAGAAGVGDSGGEADVDAGRTQRVEDGRAGEWFLVREQRITAHEHRDAAAEGAHPRRGLAGDDPAADDDEPVRHLDDARRVTRPPGVQVGEHRRDDGHRTRRQHEGDARFDDGARAAVRAHAHRLLADETCVAAHDVEACARRPVELGGVVVVRDPRVAACEERCDVEFGGPQAGQVLAGRPDVERAQQRLARHARVIGALTAEQFALYQQDAQPTVMGVLSDVLARRPATDDDDVDAAHAVRAVRLGRAVRIGGRVRTVDAGHAVRTLGLGGHASVLRRGLGCAVDEVDVFAVTPDPALDERAQWQHVVSAVGAHVVEREPRDL